MLIDNRKNNVENVLYMYFQRVQTLQIKTMAHQLLITSKSVLAVNMNMQTYSVDQLRSISYYYNPLFTRRALPILGLED